MGAFQIDSSASEDIPFWDGAHNIVLEMLSSLTVVAVTGQTLPEHLWPSTSCHVDSHAKSLDDRLIPEPLAPELKTDVGRTARHGGELK